MNNLKDQIINQKKEWEKPALTVLDVDATQGGTGQAGADNNYS